MEPVSRASDKPGTAAHVIDKWFQDGQWHSPSTEESGINRRCPSREEFDQRNGAHKHQDVRHDDTRPTEHAAQAHSLPLQKKLTMASAQDLVGMVEQMLTDKIASQRSEIEHMLDEKMASHQSLLIQQSSRIEKCIGDEMTSHRLWTADNFHRLQRGIEKTVQVASKSAPMSPRTPGNGITLMESLKNAPQLQRAGSDVSAAVSTPPRYASENSTDGIVVSVPASDVAQAKRDTLVTSLTMADEADAALQAGQLGKSHRLTAALGKGKSVPEDKASWQHSDVGRNSFHSERTKMEKHLEKMTTLEAKSSAGFRLMKKFGWDRTQAKAMIQKPNTQLLPLAESNWFAMLSISVIMLNAAWIGHTSDQGMRNLLMVPSSQNPSWYRHVDRVFSIVFFVELLIRILAYRMYFLFGKDRGWHLFDSVLVVLSILEEVFAAVNANFLRSLRIIRSARVLRMVRALRFFVGLRKILMSVVECAYVLFWASFCIGFLMYLFAIVLLQGAVMTDDPIRVKPMGAHYSNLGETMYTLLLAVSNGALWEQLAEELGEVWPLFKLFFAFYVIFVMYGILNIVTGVFVEKTALLTQRDRDLAIHHEMSLTHDFMLELQSLFDMDDVRTELDFHEFQGYLDRHEVQMYLQTQGIDHSEARTLFHLLDVDESGTLSIDEFVYGCQRLKRGIKGMDMVRLFDRVASIEAQMTSAKDRSDASYRDIKTWVGKLLMEMRNIRADILESQPVEKHM